MPELPEVETVRRSLEPYLPGRRITNIEVRDPRVLVDLTRDELQNLVGQRFTDLQRKGKQLYFPFDRDILFIHLGMTGQLTVRDPRRKDQPFTRQKVTGLERSLQHAVDPHTHISFDLEDGFQLHYRDVRKFGKWRLLPKAELDLHLRRLGPDPLTDEYTLKHFAQALAKTTRDVKAVLLDQSVLAGVGNIYADEALFVAGVRPQREARKLGRERVKRLYEAVRSVLQLGIQNGGTTLRDYIDGQGEAGSNQEMLWVYGRYGQPCRKCGLILRKAVVAQRTSTFCVHCQR